MKRLILSILCVLFLSGCLTTSYNVQHKKYDSIDNPFTTDVLKFHDDMLFKLSIDKTTLTNRNYYSIVIEYIGSNWLFIKGNVIILADDNIIRITDTKPFRRVLRNGNVQEIIRPTIKKDDLKKMANSSVLRVQFFGSPLDVNGKGISLINQFYSEYVNE